MDAWNLEPVCVDNKATKVLMVAATGPSAGLVVVLYGPMYSHCSRLVIWKDPYHANHD